MFAWTLRGHVPELDLRAAHGKSFTAAISNASIQSPCSHRCAGCLAEGRAAKGPTLIPIGLARTTTHSSTSASARETPVHGHERPATVSAVGSWPGGGRVDRPPHQGSDCDDEQDQSEQPDHCQYPKPKCSAPRSAGSPFGAVLRRAGGWAFRGAISGAGCISSSQHLTHVRLGSWNTVVRHGGSPSLS
jgi:hypothetical protein